MQKMYETVVIGAGASGLMLASLLANKSSLLLIDSSADIGAKIAISGGGKCNLTNEDVDADCYLGDSDFITRVLGQFDHRVSRRWFTQRGAQLEVREDGQLFEAKSAQTIINILGQESRGAEFAHRCTVEAVRKDNGRFAVLTSCGEFAAKNLIIASGGLSYPKLGASDIGHRIAETFGHRVITPAPALVGWTVQKEQFFFKELSGIASDVAISVDDQHIGGRLLFAHKGISGPAVLDASLYWRKGRITIDFLPGFSWEGLRASGKQLTTLLPLPKRAVKAFLKALDIDDKPGRKLSQDEFERLKTLKAYSMAPAGTFGYAKAEATRGGVAAEEIDPQSMMSRRCDNLYFLGEVLDVTGRVGGYNFQWAFSSAACCADHLNTGSRELS